MSKTTFTQALQNRRSCYKINAKSPISDAQIEKIIDFALMTLPTAFNSQSSRLVLLLGEQHKKLWNGITLDALRPLTPADHFPQTTAKINSFASGYGTVLFYEDQKVVQGLQAQFPTYANNFPGWARDASAMCQLTIWTMLEDAGLGASLQHYNPLIDAEICKTWGIDSDWLLLSQMPFGGVVEMPNASDKQPVEGRRKFIK
jgi:Predicted oxidoreductase related to nitroreductase